jgi:hypothetical protein
MSVEALNSLAEAILARDFASAHDGLSQSLKKDASGVDRIRYLEVGRNRASDTLERRKGSA